MAALTCSECGSPIPAGDEYCRKCLLGLALTTAPDDTAPDQEQPSTGGDFPKVFGNYELLERIGEGGMGVVYKARQRVLNRTVALKLMRSGLGANGPEIKRFRSEAQAAARLQHPNVVGIHEVGEHGGQLFFSMDYVEGQNLAQVIRRTPLAADRAARYARTIAEAIDYAHQCGVLHRDLKPANILLDHKDQPRITDFGLAKQIELDSELTLSGDVLGTPSYMPPEQAAGKRKEVTAQSDVYSLGAILYDCLTGRPPFRADTPVDTLRQVIETSPAAPRLLNPKVPRDLETICLKCLAKAPSDRYQSASALADDLRRFLQGETIQARPVSVWHDAWRWAKRKPGVAALAASLTLVVTMLAGTTLWLRADAADSVRFGVGHVAGTISQELTRRGSLVQTLAVNQALAALLAQDQRVLLTNWLRSAYERTSDRENRKLFENFLLLDAEGRAIARWPAPTNPASEDRHGRDYFTGAIDYPEAATSTRAHFSKIYQSQDDYLHKFGVSCVVPDESGKILGVLAAMVGTISPETLGSLTGGNRKIVLAGETDPLNLNGEPSGLPKFMIFWHFAFQSRERAVPVHPKIEPVFSELLRSTNESPRVRFVGAYDDPVARRDARFIGRWLAGFAPVPGTPYIVIYQTRDYVLNALAIGGIAAVLAGVALFGALGVRRARSAKFSPKNDPDSGPRKPEHSSPRMGNPHET